MTKYILYGGGEEENDERNKLFYKEMWKDIKKSEVNVLGVYLATSSEERVIEKSEYDKREISRWEKKKKINLQIANKLDLVKQIGWADVIYLRGGSEANKLVEGMKKIDWGKLYIDKVIAGTSAGVYALSKCFWASKSDSAESGLGIINLQTMCHFDNGRIERMEKVDKMIELDSDIPLLVLNNFQMVVIYK